MNWSCVHVLAGSQPVRSRCKVVIFRISMSVQYFKRIQPPASPLEENQTGLKLQFRRKKLILTTKPAVVIQLVIACANGCFKMFGCLIPSQLLYKVGPVAA